MSANEDGNPPSSANAVNGEGSGAASASAPPSAGVGGGGVDAMTSSPTSSSLIGSGLSSSLHGAATTFGTNRGGGFGSAFQSPGAVASGTGGLGSMGSGVGVGGGVGGYSTPGGVSTLSTPGVATPGLGTPGMPTPGGGGGARGDRRSKLVRERSRSISGFAKMATASVPSTTPGNNDHPLKNNGNSGAGTNNTLANKTGELLGEDAIVSGPALFTSFCYKGMEVIFSAINNVASSGHEDSEEEDARPSCHLLGIHARTRVPFQKCFIEATAAATTTTTTTTNNKPNPVEIVQLTSHPSTGYIFASDNYGNVHSFYPQRADPMVYAYGKFRWRAGAVARCREVFGYPSLVASTAAASGKEATNAADGRFVEGKNNVNTVVSLQSGEDGVEVSESYEGNVSTALGTSPAVQETEAVDVPALGPCFHRRKKRSTHQSSSSVPSSPGKNGSPGLQSSYPLTTDGQPPLPSTNSEAAGVPSDEYGVMICASMTEKRVLVVHKDQLAIFDFSLTTNDDKDSTAHRQGTPEALLLWTHKLQGSLIDHASISGDGCAIAVALRGEGVGVPYPFGVRTFVRDKDDGSTLGSGDDKASSNTTGGKMSAGKVNTTLKKTGSGGSGKPPIHRRSGSGVPPIPMHQSPPLPNKQKREQQQNFDTLLENVFGEDTPPKGASSATNDTPVATSQGVEIIPSPTKTKTSSVAARGILYKPAQFLVHSAPVTRLSFRGYGTITSSAQHNSGKFHDSDTEEEGNDLLLTTCSADCSVRIFSQNSWRQLMHWNSPPRSRADWVRGISAANLGDLDGSPTTSGGSTKRKKGKGEEGQLTPIPKADANLNSSMHSRNSFNSSTNSAAQPIPVSDNASVSSDTSGGINRALLASAHNQRVTPTPSSFPTHSVPGTHAGAWIAELTFRNSFPALRLSRLSYMKTGGDDALPAHFESVAAILPPGSIAEEVVLEEGDDVMGECRMEVEGIWPTWDPWEPDPKSSSRSGGGRVSDAAKVGAQSAGSGGRGSSGNTGSNNALGAPPPPPVGSPGPSSMAPRWLGDGSDLGGSHMPPSELRITSASSPIYDALCQIEMPLWGDKDFGAMEFGAPLRYVMMMPTQDKTVGRIVGGGDLPHANLEYESGSRLCARASADRRSINLCWRRHGSINFQETTHEIFGIGSTGRNDVRKFRDFSVVPLPLSLPSLTLPGRTHTHNSHSSNDLQSLVTFDKHAVSSLHWWPDENYGGPPRLVALTLGGTLLVYEMPPPWSALEPPMPAYDPFNDDEDMDSRGSSVDSDFDLSDDGNGILLDEMANLGSFDQQSSSGMARAAPEYEVSIEPHPDFGLGLRLEAQAEGMPPVAGSFKKHPLSGGRLPAERCGVVALGDELLAVNDVSLEGMSFEDAIATVRQIGFDCFGSPLRMRFRRCRKKKASTLGSSGGSANRLRTNTADSMGNKNALTTPEGNSRKVLGSGGSLATVEVGAEEEIQQGFGRIIAIVRDAIVSDSSNQLASPLLSPPPAMLLLPWNFGKGAVVSPKMYGGALILWAVPGGPDSRRVIRAARLEAVLDIDPENARFDDLGSISLDEATESAGDAGGADAGAGGAKKKNGAVKSINYISSTEKGWLVAIHDVDGNISLLFIDTTSETSSESPSGTVISATFRHYPNIFNSHGQSSAVGRTHDPQCSIILRSHSLELFGAMEHTDKCKELTVWSALPQSIHQRSGKESQQPLEYHSATVSMDDMQEQNCVNEVVVDFKWVSSGFVDAFPWLVVFTRSSAMVYHRNGMQLEWQPLSIFTYEEKLSGNATLASPQDAYPHIITALRTIILSNDEHSTGMKNDWSPDSMLAAICTETEGGARLALKSYVRGLYVWLSQWMNDNEGIRPNWSGGGSDCGRLVNAPFRIVNATSVLMEDGEEEDDEKGPACGVETSANLFSTMTLDEHSTKDEKKPMSPEEVLLSELQSALSPTKKETIKSNGSLAQRSREFMLAMGRRKAAENKNQKPLPLPLQNLSKDELDCLWAIGDILSKPPSFKKLDSSAQLSLFCVSLMQRLLQREAANPPKDDEPINSMPSYEGGRPTFVTKQSSVNGQDKKESFNMISSAAILSALMSDSQVLLLERCRPSKGEKFTWDAARAVGLPYWLRSEKKLASIAEEIAQSIYKSTKCNMDCALYYIAMRNTKKLRAISATDRSDQGKKFLKFIIDHDFTSERGRNAAEKNAYSLLRKRKYVHAASFFLLAEPPMIKTALDVIKLQLKDPSLAFLIARLVESAPKPQSNSMADGGGGLTIGGGFNLSSMGGGGGFASGFGSMAGGGGSNSGMVGAEEDDTVKFNCWKPKLGKSARSVLLPKDPPEGEDVCFESLQLLWLSRPNEAKLRLSHIKTKSICNGKDSASTGKDLQFPPVFGADESPSAGATEIRSVLKKANTVINFCMGPILLKRMKPKKRVLWSSALLVSRALGRCGMEIPSMRVLLEAANPAYNDEEDERSSPSGTQAVNENSSRVSSSIFDSHDATPSKPKSAAQNKKPVSDAMSSSIFDSFDAAPPKPKPAAPKASSSDPMSSSIFDSFDAAPPKPKPAPAPKPAPSDPMSSSIFDSFDAAPPKPKPAPAPKPGPSDPMSSSIFNSFDAAPQKPKPAAPKPAQSDPMSSSIFDSFDAAPQKPKPAAPKPAQSDPMSSSIFDSFDAAPQKPKPAAKTGHQTGGMSSSIFDSFDTAPPKRQQKSSPARPPKPHLNAVDDVENEQHIDIPCCPELWSEWRERLIHVVAARRFLRELARIISSFAGEPQFVAMKDFAQRDHPVIPTGAAEVLHNSCDSEGLLNSILKSLAELSTSFGINETAILEKALEMLSTEQHTKRIVFSVILHCLLGRGDLAEDLVRDAASFQMNSSEYLGFSNDTIVDNRETQYYTSSLWARRESSSVIWQLELCLWLHRGGAFDMSAVALKETLLAVRVGLAATAWGRCHHSLDTLIKAAPDCVMDFDSGKNLWRSMKIIVVNENTVEGIDGVTSGGWEFLVDCRREEATEMLRDGKTGQFLIRPHPQDPGVFTISFKTNLVPTEPAPTKNYDEAAAMDKPQETPTSGNPKKVVKRDDVVQHAIIRLSDSGFRCGSFGPFATLVKLLHAVSDSLPFDLRFSDPPIKGIISEKGIQTSPNAFLFRKMALHSKAQFFQFQSTKKIVVSDVDDCYTDQSSSTSMQNGHDNKESRIDSSLEREAKLQSKFGLFSQLLFLTELRKQLCAVAAAIEDEPDAGVIPPDDRVYPEITIDDDFDGSLSEGSLADDDEEALGVASRMVKPLLNWVRSREIDIVDELTPMITDDQHSPTAPSTSTHGDSMIRRMIQAGSGVDFRTLRVGEAGNSVIVVLFAKQDAIKWLMVNETGNDEAEAKERLQTMELMRVIEPITSSDLSIPKSYAASHPSTESRYRFVDPWEVEALESRSGETASAALGRGRYQALSVGLIAHSCEKIVRAAGGLHLLGLWSTLKGGITMTKALCSAHPSWERDAGGDLLMKKGFLMEPSPYDNSIRQHLYGNYLFRRLDLPQRFLALVQVELLDLKNVTSPSGSSSLTAYALLRLKRQGSSAPLNHKARSLDSACTQARKISKSSGPNAPASWGSLVRFRFPLPENVNCEGKSFDADRESLFKGPPTCLQITVYEKKFMSDAELGGADVNLESLGSGGQIEEWVPLRAGKDGITWFARIRLSLRFELLCLESSPDMSDTGSKEDRCPSVGLKKIQKLSRLGAHEDHKVKNSISTPDLVGYFGNMLY